MPSSYHLGSGFDYECPHCHYSYGRWFEKCRENYVRNGAENCSPICPEGMVMDFWKPDEKAVNDYVCLIQTAKAKQSANRY